MKTCSRCEESKSLSNFRHRDGRAIGVCKTCERGRALDYYYNNKEKAASYRAKNSERFKARDHAYYEANKERHKESMRVWRGDHREECKALVKAWVQRNPERAKANARAGSRRDRERLADSVVAGYLRMSLATASPALIQLKREQIVLHRLAKQLKQEIVNQQEKANGN
jgi:hypothetical protein